MKDVKEVFGSIALQAAYWILFFLWQSKGMDGAANVLLAWLWFIYVLGLLVFFVKPVPKPPRESWVKPVAWAHRLGTFALISALAWVGHIALAILMLLVTGLYIAKRSAETDLWRKQQVAA